MEAWRLFTHQALSECLLLLTLCIQCYYYSHFTDEGLNNSPQLHSEANLKLCKSICECPARSRCSINTSWDNSIWRSVSGGALRTNWELTGVRATQVWVQVHLPAMGTWAWTFISLCSVPSSAKQARWCLMWRLIWVMCIKNVEWWLVCNKTDYKHRPWLFYSSPCIKFLTVTEWMKESVNDIMIPFVLHNDYVRWKLLSPSIYRGRNGNKKELSNLPKVTWWVNHWIDGTQTPSSVHFVIACCVLMPYLDVFWIWTSHPLEGGNS